MVVLIGTNILLRTPQPHHPCCAAAEKAVAALRIKKEALRAAAQNLIEFRAVATRPEGGNGWGMSTQVATPI
jgi:hypothetical protein